MKSQMIEIKTDENKLSDSSFRVIFKEGWNKHYKTTRAPFNVGVTVISQKFGALLYDVLLIIKMRT